ncbi:MAG TPA: glycoside hydrolase family 57 protein [Vicinamibacterales bacterium]|nr:glycoside hydrolase family 57 protein [Vicinamibacterales bacterium]
MVKLALLWHMHQPYYEDLATGEHILPWVRLHAIKDYWGMVALLREFPRIRVTFNLVPSLIAQVEAFAAGRARDRHLAAGLKTAAELTPDEARWMVANGFHAPYEQMIRPYPRYAELHALRMARRAFTEGELRDLQVWHKLAWMDPDLLTADQRLAALIKKDRDYTEDDKARLRDVEIEVLKRVVPEYRAAGERGQVELATSPFYHPILPLLCDSDAHLRAHPEAARPRTRFHRPDDARLQIDRAIAFHTQVFGSPPKGMWPSEGSVSDEAVRLIADAGLQWIATDEDILSRSLSQPMRAELLYRPYRIGDKGPVALFRDHALSDRIGFHYKSWDANAAADDFVGRVRDAGRRFAESGGSDQATVAVILDGENAWEYYPGGGRPFLRALYGALERAEDIQTVTMAEAAAGPAHPLPSVFPGSWINADFYIWIGHRDDHRAWDQLSAARAAFDARAGAVDGGDRDRALEEILIAEGSDWFWWYGDDHSSDHDADFDQLFRRHLRNAYDALGLPAPEELFATNISTGSGPDRLEPSGFVNITLDGQETSYLEWVGAVSPALARPAGAMHEVATTSLITEIHVAISRQALCLRLKGSGLFSELADGATLALILGGSEVRVIPFEREWIGVGTIFEAAIPFARLGVEPGAEFQFGIQVRDSANAVLESMPHGRCWTIVVPNPADDSTDWQA